MKKSIALVFMTDDCKNFFIEDPPKKPIPKWIGKFAEISQVEHVHVLEAGGFVSCWSNPDVNSEQ